MKSGRGRKSIAPTSVVVEDVATALEEGTISGVQMCSARSIALYLDMPTSTVQKIICNILHCSPYKNYTCTGFVSCWPAKKRGVCSAISRSQRSGQWMVMEHFVDRWITFLPLRVSQHAKLQDMGKRKVNRNCITINAFTKGNCVMRVHSIMYGRAICPVHWYDLAVVDGLSTNTIIDWHGRHFFRQTTQTHMHEEH